MDLERQKKIGLLIGREWSWPSAFIADINGRKEDMVADFIKIRETDVTTPCSYDVIIDRMSHEIPYYRTYLKYAAMSGSYVINNPFMAASDDKFFGIALANKLSINTPKTVALPNKRVETEDVPETFRNLIYPMDWQGIIDYVGVPAILKDSDTGGRRMACRVHNIDDLLQAYDESNTLTVILQEVIESDIHVHCFVIGFETVLVIQYSMVEQRYVPSSVALGSELESVIIDNSLRVTRAYGYDINMVEFVVYDNQAILVNPANPVPDLDILLLTPKHFGWCVTSVANLAIKMANKPRLQFDGYDWHKAIGIGSANPKT